ncbi:NAD-dependent epimerase/dehydratase family protein [Bacillus sp. 31A1R]|uniref:NAD-dependent epimerase/dehydratase family protein n=1 Tax=Robertmurraya mangrovi TaxID=3098077 RepID=A0ABU5J2C0_9BACI|nr:NAD-dependent epimerase/dehydratase family protein [Bacillus sp. 31A1R]MDZ5473500.1 NAD-dependent epimerase/dehydratase family protein [Bacillus sp. 31A1R]
MKKALVLGATGGMGYSLVEELVGRNIETIAFGRSQQKLQENKEDWGPLASIMVGDALNKNDLKEAISKADLVFHSINIPYEKWDPTLLTILTNILEECHSQNKPFIYVDNIYSYGRHSNLVTEDTQKNPHTKKGNFRLKLINEIKKSGVPYLIAHFPDFYGPKADNTLLQYTFEQVLKKGKGGYVGDPTIKREFIYIKDGANALVELALRDDTYNESWNIPGASTITGEEISVIASQYLNKDVKFSKVTKWMIAMIGIVDPSMREYVEMTYLNETPVILSGSKYEQRIGPVPRTPYEVGVVNTLISLAK